MKKSTKIFVFGGLICLLAGTIIMLITGAVGGVNIAHTLITDYSFGKLHLSDDIVNGFEDTDFTGLAGTKAISVSKNEISAVKIAINGGEISIREGRSDQIEICTDSLGLDYAVENGTLIIKEEKNRVVYLDGQEIVVYLPEGMRFENIEIAVGGGELEAYSLNAEKITLKVGAGDADIESMNAGDLDINAGAGNITVERGNITGSTRINVGLGEADFYGTAGDDVDLKCGMGELSFSAEGMNFGEYNYEMRCGAGNICLNGNDYSGVGLTKYIDNGSEKTINIDCGMGEIDIDFSLF